MLIHIVSSRYLLKSNVSKSKINKAHYPGKNPKFIGSDCVLTFERSRNNVQRKKKIAKPNRKTTCITSHEEIIFGQSFEIAIFFR